MRERLRQGGEDRRLRARLLDWMARFWAVRGLGGAADAMMVASGQAEVWIEPSASPWDFAPLKVILEEAGARYLNVDGGSSIYAGNAHRLRTGAGAGSAALSRLNQAKHRHYTSTPSSRRNTASLLTGSAVKMLQLPQMDSAKRRTPSPSKAPANCSTGCRRT